MHSNKALRVTLLSVILVLGSFMALITPTVGAESTSGETTFYFKDAFDFENFDDGGEFGDFLGLTPVSQTPPTKQNDSEYPPSLFIKDTSKLLPRYELNSEEWILWLTGWAFYFLEDLEGFNLSDIFGLFEEFGFEDFDDYDLDLLMDLMLQNPLRIVGYYGYDGNESIEINDEVIFDLYFSSELRRPKLRDDVEIALYSMTDYVGIPLPKLIKNTTVQIKPKILSDKQEIILENISYTLEPGEGLLFSIKIIPSDKPISNMLEKERPLLEKFEEKVINWIKEQENNTERPKLQELAILVEEMEFLAEEFNVTKEDVGEILNAIRSSSFLYDSINHPSSVTVPFTIPSDTENTKIYYLHDGNVMDTSKPSDTEQDLSLSDVASIWEGPMLNDRNKIIKVEDVSVSLYLQYRKVLKSEVLVTLLDGDTEIASSVQEIGFDFFGNTPTVFTFENEPDYELFYRNSLSISVSLVNGSNPGILRKMYLLYDSNEKPSSVQVTFAETDNIQFDYVADPEDELIVPDDKVTYTLNITSKRDDDVYVDILSEEDGDWTVTVTEDMPLSMEADGSADVHIVVKSENNKTYGDTIDLTFVVSGKTGIAKKTASVEVSEDAIEYDVDIIGQEESKNIKKGKNGIFYFIIENKNTGAEDDVDSYTITAESKNNWEVINTEEINNLQKGEKTDLEDILVVVTVPKNTTLNSDVITVTVTSDSDPEAFAVINVTINVKESSIFESIYEFFESAANSLGFDDLFGSKAAPWALAGILLILIVLIIAILIFLLRRKSVNIVCTDRIQEIDPDGEAVFEIILKNPTKKTKTYEITSKEDPPSSKWQTATDRERMTIAARKSETILLVVKPIETTESNDWTEVKLNVRVTGKKRSEEITTMVMVKEGKTLLRIKDVFSWPKEFKKGDRVTTSFKLENAGSISARNVQVVLFINGKQKNKVEVTIPSGGYADIKIPWIALKGKNELQLKAIEQ